MQYKAAFHLDSNDPFLLKLCLENIVNFLRQEPAAELRLVVNGPAVNLFRVENVASSLAQLDALAAKGVAMLLCANALAKNEISVESLPASCGVVAGGVVELARLQHEGFAYIKP